jgi:hypothetical protein
VFPRLELVTVPLADVDRAKAFYVEQVGFQVEQDVRVNEGHGIQQRVQQRGPGSRGLPRPAADRAPPDLGKRTSADDREPREGAWG